jgi:hypothetical protein
LTNDRFMDLTEPAFAWADCHIAVGLGPFERHDLGLGEHQAVLGALGLQALSRFFFMVSRSGLLGQAARFQKGREVAAFPELGDARALG